jgi:NOL1/NOP2/fmu family ribosome biogenesis protein
MIQVFGHHAVRGVLDITPDNMKKMTDGMHISTDMEIDNGYIILSFKGAILGLGLFIDGRVSSQIPGRDLILFS